MLRIVDLADKSTLRVMAHAVTESDFQWAVRAGVSVVGHMPLFDPLASSNGGWDDYLMTEKLAEEASRRNVVVVLTAGSCQDSAGDDGRMP